MRRYWVEEESFQGFHIGAEVRLSGDTLHHVRDVCRQTVGDKFEVLVNGAAYLVEVTSDSKREMDAVILECREIEQLPFPRLKLALAIPRFNVFESVLEKMVEMGVEAVQPLYSDNSFLRTDTEAWKGKESRFQKIIQGATQQTGRGEKMQLPAAMKLTDFVQELRSQINRGESVAGLFAYEIGTLPVRQALQAFVSVPGQNSGLKSPPKAIWIFVGGEGGFSQAEVALFANLGFPAVTLGRQVLRVETACVTLASVLKYELDLMR
ncbi:MAG: 16S rRNA (uracil(1498)-N(3))-methyltransferase [Deltaproteobacteria bacterium]|jgi:16S rRNA (uracil1498-N3)-methyltransferase|nr:16S rRNA (uracil(1498)-N(3))-methyltransferase [Deltaproteobacteria bacterium]